MYKVIKDIDQSILSYPLLKRVEEKGYVRVVGEIPLIHSEKGEFDRYEVSIRFPQSYPKCFPKVIETSEKIPRKDFRHVNPDLTLCLAVEPEEKAIANNGINFKYFLDKVLVPHLARETFREINGAYPDGEYTHGNSGIWEFYESALESTDRKLIISELEEIIYSKWQGRNELCKCGSGRKFKRCHLDKWNTIIKSGRDYIIEKLDQLKKEL
tara:strand:- start:37056 stop:37691 length:636 start_codon:yes stop_codon:yes gene_type:complete